MANGLDRTGGEEIGLMDLADILGCEELDEILEGEGGASDAAGDDEPVQFFAEELIWKEIIRGRGENLDVDECDDCLPLDELIPCRGLDFRTLREGGGHDFSVGDLGSEIVVLKEDKEDIEFEVIPAHHGEIHLDTDDVVVDEGEDVVEMLEALPVDDAISILRERFSQFTGLDSEDCEEAVAFICFIARDRIQKAVERELRRDIKVITKGALKGWRSSHGNVSREVFAARKGKWQNRRGEKLKAMRNDDEGLNLHSRDFDEIPTTEEL